MFTGQQCPPTISSYSVHDQCRIHVDPDTAIKYLPVRPRKLHVTVRLLVHNNSTAEELAQPGVHAGRVRCTAVIPSTLGDALGLHQKRYLAGILLPGYGLRSSTPERLHPC